MTASYRIEVAHTDAEFEVARESYEDENGFKTWYEYLALPYDAEVKLVADSQKVEVETYDLAWAGMNNLLRLVPSYSADGHYVVVRVTLSDGTGQNFYACGWSKPEDVVRP